jgi:hypothetical protein
VLAEIRTRFGGESIRRVWRVRGFIGRHLDHLDDGV